MERSQILRLTERLRAELAAGGPAAPATFTVPAARYRDPAWCARERAALFRGPRIVAASASLDAGACAPIDRADVGAAIIARGPDGVLRGFSNACRHRGTRLVDAPCTAKALVCPYHAWTYDLTGALIHVPHAAAFPGLSPADRGLSPRPVTERHGLVWLGDDVDGYLGDLGPDLAALALDRHVPWRRARTTRRCNWKLVIEAFLEGYHAKYLHNKTIARFFVDGVVVFDRFGRHVRSAGGRRELLKWPKDGAAGSIREAATMFYFVFPNTILVLHPDWISHITMFPETASTSTYVHTMLVPRATSNDPARWRETWNLIEGAVFQKEDLVVADSIQASFGAGIEREFAIGGLELPIRHFHDAIENAIDRT